MYLRALAFLLFAGSLAHADPRLDLFAPIPPAPTPRDNLLKKYKDWRGAVSLFARGNFTMKGSRDGSVRFFDHLIPDGKAQVDGEWSAFDFGPTHLDGQLNPFPVRGVAVRLAFTADATDWLMRAHGEDPYRIQKQQLLDATFLQRAARAGEFRHASLLRALDHLPRHLDWIWLNPSYDARAREATLTQLWCESDSEERGHGEKSAGEEARAIIAQFAKQHAVQLPAKCR